VPSRGWKNELKQLFPQARLQEPMARHTTFRIGGSADCFLFVSDLTELKRFFRWKRTARARAVPVLMLGWGSNLLVRDGGISGVVLKLKGDFDRIARRGKNGVDVGSAVRLPRMAVFCAQHGLGGAQSP